MLQRRQRILTTYIYDIYVNLNLNIAIARHHPPCLITSIVVSIQLKNPNKIWDYTYSKHSITTYSQAHRITKNTTANNLIHFLANMTQNYYFGLTLQLVYRLALVLKVSIKKTVNIYLLPLDLAIPVKLCLCN